MTIEEKNQMISKASKMLTEKFTNLGIDTVTTKIPLPYDLFAKLSELADFFGMTLDETAEMYLKHGINKDYSLLKEKLNGNE